MLAPQHSATLGYRPAARRLTDMFAVASGTLAGVLVWVLVVAAMALL